jgi:bifunctional non-homologous end joining protein LigD
MVAKRLSSPNQRGRSADWLKIKNAGYGRPAALGWDQEKKA